MGYCVYILRCSDGTLYTGISNNIIRRVVMHNRGRGAKYTRTRRPVTLVYMEDTPNKGYALRRELAIKRLTKQSKDELIAAYQEGIERMNVLNTVRARRNIKQFTSAEVAEKDWMEWLQAAAYAPNHHMAEPWQVQVVGPETRARLHHKTDFGGAPLVLAILAAPGKSDLEERENLIATSCFIQNFSLIAHEAGAGTRWSSVGSTHAMREVLEVPEGFQVVGVLATGYPAEVPDAKPRSPIVEKVHLLP